MPAGRLIAFIFVLSCTTLAQHTRPVGAWIPIHINWQHAPVTLNPKLESAATSVLFFDVNSHFAVIDCVLLGPDSLRISHGDGQQVSTGAWDGRLPGLARYRLVSRTVEKIGEVLPGRWETEKLARRGADYLLFRHKLYQRAPQLESEVRELLRASEPDGN